ncbi:MULTISPECIES: acyl-CoA dehydrogenase family protein [Rhodococcus]|uniref:Acyl-CoA dehydrogenase family protein n=1 Tax=Rhodococcus oxybenzonivorans TaxID=1990687 RepID=A0AAE5A5F4_9NOCA|nr:MULTISPECIES: acyl-CoA dehydrogenase family protein [Rhodococcus]MDV7243397.1 acyl-CoA dehydrogenase family protein [Rhodococcus oxybenzonivorans]MDV7263903.1 acyl-CoA dehydrogenase family protein [Rhodococcus oxybenzonivorans]MDV7276823.1 acyl-CoA dehydrogenase family protein [Rhodococcus oxybenzonivorans]MDV7334343.1 acyl-CoA dehydrogenase family protein [Rhodococcus oxybenzonivorans]MDV7344498.1 acyl-CoA dehydrogenase family protein [Rhodococcus oxybenzonivorans]
MTAQTLPALTTFTDEAVAWLQSVAPPRTASVWGSGSDSVAVFENWTAEQEREHTDEISRYEKLKFDAGWGALNWPTEYGGHDLPLSYVLAFRRAEEAFDIPRRTEMFSVTQQLVAPTIAQWGTEEQKARYVRALLRTDLIACQLFSETEAGSDLAAVRTKAVQNPDRTWQIDGHKVWTSGASVSDFGVAVCRTDPAAAKHAGLTVFLVPMDARGVTIRPIRQMTGGSSFNEVYLDTVTLDDTYRLGPVGKGWQVALTVLAAERLDGGNLGLANADQAVALAQNLGRELSEIERDKVADLVTRSYLQRVSNMRVAGALVAGNNPGPEASLGKLLATDTMARTSEVARMLLGRDLTADSGRWGTFAWSEHVLGAPGYKIAGGTDEIQHNIIAERVLGLPREPRP